MTSLRTVWVLVVCLAAVACAQGPERPSVVTSASGDHHISVRAEAGRLWWAHRAWGEPHELWKLPSNGPVENLAVRPVAAATSGASFEITFDQGGASWHGNLVVDETALLDSPVAFLGGNERLAESVVFDLARSGR